MATIHINSISWYTHNNGFNIAAFSVSFPSLWIVRICVYVCALSFGLSKNIYETIYSNKTPYLVRCAWKTMNKTLIRLKIPSWILSRNCRFFFISAFSLGRLLLLTQKNCKYIFFLLLYLLLFSCLFSPQKSHFIHYEKYIRMATAAESNSK